MAQPLPKHRSREYETILIINPDAGEAVDQVAGRLTDVIGRLEGKLLRAENWGKRKLAYPVAKNQKGIYLYLRYLGYSDLVHEIERNMRMLEPVVKYITVKLDEDIDPEARPVREEDISFMPQYEMDEHEPAEKRSVPPEPAKAPAATVATVAKPSAPEETKAQAVTEETPSAEATKEQPTEEKAAGTATDSDEPKKAEE